MKKTTLLVLSYLLFVAGFSQMPTTGLIAFYPFTGDARDSSNNGNDGIVHGAVLTSDRFGNSANAYLFNGSSDYISLPSGNTTSLNIVGDYSVSFWIKTLDSSGLITSIGDNVTSPPNAGGYLTGLNGKSLGYGKLGVGTRGNWSSSVTNSLADDAWHNVIVALQNDKLTIYVDGVLDNEVTGIAAPLTWNGSRVLGCRNDLYMTPETNYGGILDDVAIYNRALTVNEVDRIYNGSGSDTIVCISTPTGTDDNGWSYIDYIVPSGYKIDSVYADFSRTSYPTSEQDFIFEYCANTTTYSAQTATLPFNYQTVNTSLYNTWIDLTSYSYTGQGVAMVRLPTNFGATWNNFCFALSRIKDTTVCFSSASGTDNDGWSIVDYIIPTNYKIDSVFGDFTRPGYATSEQDFIFEYCANTTTYNTQAATLPFNYQTINTSLYNTWIDLTSYNYMGQGVARVRLPTNAGAVWNDLCFALSYTDVTTNLQSISYRTDVRVYPNPVNDLLIVECTIENYTVRLSNVVGQIIHSTNVMQSKYSLNVNGLQAGIYIVSVLDVNGELLTNKKIVVQ